jgi:hypothetical protein
MSDKSSIEAARLLRKQDAQAAVSEYALLQKATQNKIARLRAMRIAKEAADRAAADEAAVAKTITKKPATKLRNAAAANTQINKTKDANLSDRALRHE